MKKKQEDQDEDEKVKYKTIFSVDEQEEKTFFDKQY